MERDTHSQPPAGDGAISLRPEQDGDDPLLYEIYAATRTSELELTGWDQPTRAAFLGMQFRAMRSGYASMFPRARFSIILLNGQPAGRIVIDRCETNIHVVDIALLPSRYGQGIGTVVMKEILREAERSQKLVRLRALRDERTLRFYRRLGFRVVEETAMDANLEWQPVKRD